MKKTTGEQRLFGKDGGETGNLSGTSLLTPNRSVMLTINMSDPRAEVLQGTLDLLILKTLAVIGTHHGFGIARRIEQVSADVLALNQGTLYPALLRLEQQGLIESEWGTSTNNRRARFYSLTKRGRAQLAKEIADWQRVSGAVNNIIANTGEAGATA
jgi:PadR family transcriptional regulator PadR